MVTSSSQAGGHRPTERVAAIIVAAGASTRMSGDKLWADLAGEPLVARSIRVFAASPAIDMLIMVVAAGREEHFRELLARLGVGAEVVTGGAERQDSVRAGLEAADDAEWVVIHDAARPMVTGDLITQGLVEARSSGAAIAAVPAVDTIKVVESGRIVATPERGMLWHAQTPQVFRRSILFAAHATATSAATDDAALVESLGVPVRVYRGSYANLKVTTDSDLVVARALLMAVAKHGDGGQASRSPFKAHMRG
jgi:2-C-methyl-D-erythritol 4-phosphate cytidylyltransferase